MCTLIDHARTVVVSVAVMALGLAGCGPLPAPSESGELVVAVRESPSTYFLAHDGEHAGFEHDLIESFASSRGWSVTWKPQDTPADLFALLDRQRAHLGAASLPRAVVRDRHLIVGPTLFETPVHIVVRDERGAPRKPAQLQGKRVALILGSGHAAMLTRLKRQHPGLSWAVLENVWPEELLAELMAGRYDAVAISGMDFDPLRTLYPGLRVAFDLADKQKLVWALPRTSSRALRNALADYVSTIRRDGTLAQVRERYFGHVGRLTGADVLGMLERKGKRLDALRRHFQEAQTLTGIDWRLLAAIGYQESQWDPYATSPTGVRGIMMLTGATADRLGVSNRLDPRQSILGGARYVAMMRDALPARIPEPDRTWIALAAYNQGQGHMEDARRIAQARGGDPDRWVDVKDALPYLGRGRYAHVTRYGYARGAEALIFAENVRNYYDILLRTEPAWEPLFQLGRNEDEGGTG